MQSIRDKGYAEPLKQYIASGKPYMGICIGLQTLFEGSDEAPGVPGLGVVPGIVSSFSPFENDGKDRKSVPQMGWNTAKRGNVFATQFHPEKSGRAGLELLRAWLSQPGTIDASKERLLLDPQQVAVPQPRDGLTKRIVACLDVRSNDDGDLVVTKGESYDVREKADAPASHRGSCRGVRIVVAQAQGTSRCSACSRLRRPRSLCRSRSVAASRTRWIRTEHPRPAKEVADAYFRAGADKVSIGSEAVYAVEELYARAAQNGQQGELDPLKFSDACLTGKTGIEDHQQGIRCAGRRSIHRPASCLCWRGRDCRCRPRSVRCRGYQGLGGRGQEVVVQMYSQGRTRGPRCGCGSACARCSATRSRRGVAQLDRPRWQQQGL
ncbi:hypothetical protein L1887_60020 [Cichorium endivia]|nr:hypothetical protein L1887_60020 [Cichorium endivia]